MKQLLKLLLNSTAILSLSFSVHSQCPDFSSPVTASNSTICEGSSVQLFTPSFSNCVYFWTGPNGFTSNQQNPIIPIVNSGHNGVYTVVITNTVLNCTVSPNGNESLALTVIAQPILNAISAYDTTPCSRYDTLKLFASSSSNVDYYWNSPPDTWGNTIYTSNQQNPTFPNPGINYGTGYWYLTITDQNTGCTATDSLFIEPLQNPHDDITEGPLNPQINNNWNKQCENDSGYIELLISYYDTTHLIYSWTGPNGFAANTQDIYFNPWKPEHNGTFDVIVTDTITGCYNYGGKYVTILDAPELENELLSKYNICSEENILMDPMNNENPDYDYSWYGPNGNIISTADSLGFYPLTYADTGTYNLIVTETFNYCKSYYTFDLHTTDIDSISLDPNYYSCGANNVFLDFSNYDSINVNGAWTNNNLSNYPFDSSGVYSISAMLNECLTNNQTISISLDSNQYTVYDNIDDDLCFGDDFEFGFSSPGTYTINWNGVNNYTSATPDNTIYEINENHLGQYYYTATFSNGCVYNGNINLSNVDNSCYAIPEIFTPNGDGLNDTWVLDFLKYYPNNSVTIFNRWGNKVFFAAPYQNSFDGYPNKGIILDENILPNGTYYYQINLGDDSEKINGVLELQR